MKSDNLIKYELKKLVEYSKQTIALLDIKEINDKVDKIISMSKSTYINSKNNMIDKGEDFIYE